MSFQGRATFWTGLIVCTALLGTLWAVSINLVIVDVAVAHGGNAEGRLISEITTYDSFYTMTRGKAQIIQGVNLFNVTGVAPEYNNKRLVVRAYIMNPGDMGGALHNPHAYILVMATDQTDEPWSGVSYGGVILTAEKAYGSFMPEIPWDEDSFRIRATIVVPGGSPPGQQKNLTDLFFRVEISPR